MIDALLSALAMWATENSDILAVGIVGSHARGATTANSDIDIVLIVVDPGRYFTTGDWMKRFGEVSSLQDEDWGRLRSRRVSYIGGLEVEFGFTVAAWASTDPVDPGTRRVVAGGVVSVHDPKSILRSLVAGMQNS
jgi:hypothetical protein